MIIIINSFLFHYCKNDNKLQMYLRLEGKQKYQREAKTNAQCAITGEREQYWGTVHLFIGTGRSLCIITFMPFTIVAEPPELFQLKCLSHASGAVTHLNRNNPSVPQI